MNDRARAALSKANPPRPIPPVGAEHPAWPHGFGRCHCGCGGTTNTAPQSIKRTGQVKGEHFKWLQGHDKKSERVSLSCKHCSQPFLVLKHQAETKKFCSLACRNAGHTVPEHGRRKSIEVTKRRTGKANPAYKHGGRAGYRDREGERRFQSGQSSCQHPKCKGGAHTLHQHHVVYKQHVRAEGGDIWDGRNAIALCNSCHTSHHQRGRPLPVSAFRPENLEFAVELLGVDRAAAYIERRYRIDDTQGVEAWVARLERDYE